MRVAYPTPRSARGFTLVELMIVVAILAILSAIAYPSYQQTLVDQRRNDAQSTLLAFVNAMERYRSDNNSYAGAEAGTSFPSAPKATVFPSQAPIDGATKYYNLTIESANASGFTLRATPITGTSQEDTGYLQINAAGQRSWDQNDNGAIDSGENTWKSS